jgi:hypothetical protein
VIAVFVGLFFAGIAMLGRARGPRWLRVLGRGLSAAVAIGFTALAIALYRLGADRGWTGDGPGMLVVMLAIPVAALCALAAWAGLLVPSSAESRVSPWLAIGAMAVGLAGCFYTAFEVKRDAQPSHAAPVAAIAFVDGGAALVSIDTAGTVRRWRAKTHEVLGEWSAPELAGARAIVVSADGATAIALFGDRAVARPLDAPRATRTLPGVADAALLPGDRAALALDRSVLVVAAADPARIDVERKLPLAVRAVAADRQGRIYGALADGALVAIESADAPRTIAQLPAAPARLLASPGGTWLAAVDADGKGRIVATATGDVREIPGFGVHAAAFLSDGALGFNSGPQDGAAQKLSLDAMRTEPWIGQGVGIAALAVAEDAGLAAFAAGRDVHLLAAPGRGNAYTSNWHRLAR